MYTCLDLDIFWKPQWLWMYKRWQRQTVCLIKRVDWMSKKKVSVDLFSEKMKRDCCLTTANFPIHIMYWYHIIDFFSLFMFILFWPDIYQTELTISWWLSCHWNKKNRFFGTASWMFYQLWWYHIPGIWRNAVYPYAITKLYMENTTDLRQFCLHDLVS